MMEIKTLLEYFYKWEQKTPNDPYLKQPFGDTWETYTWHEVGQMARKLAIGLQSMGLRDKAHIALVSKPCREWVIADLAIMMAGYVSVPLYPTLTGKQTGEVLQLGDVDFCIIGKTEVWNDMKQGIPEEMGVLHFPHYNEHSMIDRGYEWHDFINQYDPMKEDYVPDIKDLWTIVFTSGTTGTPKGVMLSYELLNNCLDLTKEVDFLQCMDQDNRFFSYLPLNHIAERCAVEVQSFYWGGTLSFAENLQSFSQNIRDTEPTLLFGVPRIWNKFQLGVLAKIPQSTIDTALKIPIAKTQIKKKVQKALGLHKARVLLSGAAPISKSLKDWYKSLGMPLCEGYGQTENLGAVSYLKADDERPGSVGKLYPGTEIKIAPDSEEILLKAPWNMLGYYNRKDLTQKTIIEDWLHTGDQGKYKDGYLYITGRVKDTFKTAKGQFIVPAPMEWVFDYNTDIEQICITGVGLVQPVALVVLSDLAKQKTKQNIEESLTKSLEEVNCNCSSYQKISHVVIVNEPWSVENGILTPTLKVKRPALNQKFGARLEQFTAIDTQIVWEE